MQRFPSGGAKNVKICCAYTPISERNTVIMTAVMSITQQKEKSSTTRNMKRVRTHQSEIGGFLGSISL